MARIISATIVAIIAGYLWTARKHILNWAFNHKTDQPETPNGWTPRMRTWKHGIEQ